MREAKSMYEQLASFHPIYSKVVEQSTQFTRIDIEMSQKLAKQFRAVAKECYHNAFKIAKKNPRQYAFYCGYATSVIPLPHAWNVDRATGTVIDTTWVLSEGMMRNPTFKNGECDFFGMEISLPFIEKRIDMAYDFSIPAMFIVHKEGGNDNETNRTVPEKL
jgi:hypothetical protein